MANIVIALYRTSKDPMIPNSMPPYYEGVLSGLKEAGNNILCFIHDIHNNEMSWDEKDIPEHILQKIKNFAPDAFVLFNYDFYDLTHIFDVPFIIYDVDSPNRYHNKTAITQYPGRYKFAVIQKAGIELIKSCYNVEESMIRYIRPFTEIRNREEDIKHNIAFCGSHWLWSGCSCIYDFMKLQPSDKEREMAKIALKKYSEFPFGDIDDIYKQYGNVPDRRLKNHNSLLAGRLSGLKRAEYLSYIADLGLDIRGEYWNHPSLNFFPELALCYNREPTVTIFENENYYNCSKIGFNINHIQAKTGFSWRVCDILASNACLVSEYTPDLDAEFSSLGIPMYTSKEEARELCIKLLSDESMRCEIVAASNELINQKYRFKNILGDLEELCNTTLQSDQTGNIEIINLTKFLNSNNTHTKQVSFKDRVERKIWTIMGENLRKKGVI